MEIFKTAFLMVALMLVFIAVLIESEASLCELAKFEIDAAILPNAIK